jgi:hypothetical protein
MTAGRAIELRQYRVADAVPGVLEVIVRFVLDPPFAALREIVSKLRAREVKERSNHPTAPGINARESRQSGAAHQLQQERFRLVVLRMAHRNAVGSQGIGRTLQEVISDPAGRIFDRQASSACIPFDVGAFHEDPEIEAIGQLATEHLIAIRGWAESVIEMR